MNVHFRKEGRDEKRGREVEGSGVAWLEDMIILAWGSNRDIVLCVWLGEECVCGGDGGVCVWGMEVYVCVGVEV